MADISRIRAVAREDLLRLEEIRAAAFAPVFRSFRRLVGEDIAAIAFTRAEEEQAAHLKALCKSDAPGQVFVYDTGDCLAGFVAITLDRCSKLGEIGLNAVHPDYQGQGVASALYAHAMAEMRQAGMRAATVGTGADDSHAAARAAYEKAGFSPGIPNLYYYRML